MNVAEILDLEGTLDKLRRFGPIRRVILATPGTLQGALTAYFGSPVDVEVRLQNGSEDERHFTREVDLVCRKRRLVVCRARTDVVVEDEAVRSMLVEQKVGLGQIVELLRIPATFDLEEVGKDSEFFWRTYELRGAGFRYHVEEKFPSALYPEGEVLGS